MSPFVRDRVLPFFGFLLGFLVLAGLAVTILRPHDGGTTASAVGGPFTLTDADGHTVTQQALLGHPTLVFFGYTHCPDVCPAALSEMSAVFKALGPQTEARGIFVTVDPQRDTPVVMKDYLTSFDPHIMGLTGTPQAIKTVEREYKVYAKPAPDKDGTYSVDHTAVTYLMNKHGDFVGAFNLDQSPAAAAAELKQYF